MLTEKVTFEGSFLGLNSDCSGCGEHNGQEKKSWGEHLSSLTTTDSLGKDCLLASVITSLPRSLPPDSHTGTRQGPACRQPPQARRRLANDIGAESIRKCSNLISRRHFTCASVGRGTTAQYKLRHCWQTISVAMTLGRPLSDWAIKLCKQSSSSKSVESVNLISYSEFCSHCSFLAWDLDCQLPPVEFPWRVQVPEGELFGTILSSSNLGCLDPSGQNELNTVQNMRFRWNTVFGEWSL